MKPGLILVTLILLILGGCGNPLTDFALFNAYRGVNLMAGVEFEISPTNWTISPLGTTDHREILSAGPLGPDGVAPSVRLASINQLQDGNWYLDRNLDLVSTTNSSLNFTRGAENQFLWRKINAPADLTTFITPAATEDHKAYSVTIDFELSNTTEPQFFGLKLFSTVLVPPDVPSLDETLNSIELGLFGSENFQPNTSYRFQASGIIPRAEADAVKIGSDIGIQTNIGSIRMLEDNKNLYYMEISLPKQPPSTPQGLSFIPGGRFEFAIHAQKVATLNPNERHADFLTIELGALKPGETQPYKTSSSSLDISSTTAGSWTEFRFSISNPLEFEILNQLTSTDDTLIIRIFPFQDQRPDAGIILLSNPQLFYFPE